MASAYADQAIQLREYASVSEDDLAAVTGARLDAVRAWLDGRAAPTPLPGEHQPLGRRATAV